MLLSKDFGCFFRNLGPGTWYLGLGTENTEFYLIKNSKLKIIIALDFLQILFNFKHYEYRNKIRLFGKMRFVEFEDFQLKRSKDEHKIS